MHQFLGRRLVETVVVLLGITTAVFLVLHLTGDPASLLLPEDATEADRAAVRQQMGFDRPLALQYARFLEGAVRFDFIIIIIESSLSFLGLGVPPPTQTWGGILGDGRQYIDTAWWIALFPGLAIMASVLSVNLVGDWLRDVMDPRVRE